MVALPNVLAEAVRIPQSIGHIVHQFVLDLIQVTIDSNKE